MTSLDSSNQYPGHRYAWFMVVMLTVAYVFSFVDRYIMGLLAESIKADLNLTDTQIGIALGPAFGIPYALMALPIGLLADYKRRTWIVAFGVGLWSLATAATGLAKSFIQVAIARAGVGFGEASLSPCAMSMISDSFPPERRGKPIAFYTAALSLGAGAASIFAATIINWTNTMSHIRLPLFGDLAAWQFVFIILGVPGVFFALIFFFLKEPKRTMSKNKDVQDKQGLINMLKHVRQNMLPFFGIIVLQSSMMVIAYSQGWLAPAFERTWGWAPEKYASINGIILLCVGPATVFFSGWLADKLFKQGRRNASFILMISGILIAVPTGALATVMPTAELALVVLAVNTFGIAMASAAGPVALLNITPGQFRGQVVALYYMIAGFAGSSLGPTTVSTFSDYVFGNEYLNYALSITALLYGIPALLFGFYAKKAYEKKLMVELGA